MRWTRKSFLEVYHIIHSDIQHLADITGRCHLGKASINCPTLKLNITCTSSLIADICYFEFCVCLVSESSALFRRRKITSSHSPFSFRGNMKRLLTFVRLWVLLFCLLVSERQPNQQRVRDEVIIHIQYDTYWLILTDTEEAYHILFSALYRYILSSRCSESFNQWWQVPK
jgi:hypothetical protein